MLEAVFKFKTLNWNDAFFEIDMIENQIKLRSRDFAYISSILRAFQKCCWHSDLGNAVYSSWLLWKVEKTLKCDRPNTINNNITECLVNTPLQIVFANLAWKRVNKEVTGLKLSSKYSQWVKKGRHNIGGNVRVTDTTQKSLRIGHYGQKTNPFLFPIVLCLGEWSRVLSLFCLKSNGIREERRLVNIRKNILHSGDLYSTSIHPFISFYFMSIDCFEKRKILMNF